MKSNKKQLLISTVLCLLPMIFGVAIYGKLPAEIPTKWYSDGTVGQFMPKSFTVFGMPLFMAVINAFVHFSVNNDPKTVNIGSMIKLLGKWLVPVLSLVVVPMSLCWGLGYKIPVDKIVPVLIGVLFVVLGNYFPKSRRNYTAGIRTPWTLNSDENWNKTHHLAAFVWIAGGIGFMLMTFLPAKVMVPAILILISLLAVAPFVYSYLLYKKGI